MEEIKVGEYVRIKNGEIFKIDENTANYYNSNKNYITNEVTKHNFNVLEILEVGDIIIHGVETIFITAFEDELNLSYFKEIYKNHTDSIKSILTKEQYEANCYKVEVE